MNIVAIIQARMESTRLPEKVMKKVVGKPILWHIFNRLKYAKLIDEIVIATSNNKRDKCIINFAKTQGIMWFAGSELDLLDRIYQAVKKFEADAVVRITADCPLVDPLIVDKTIKYYLAGEFNYVSNARPEATYPCGLDVEIFSFTALEKAWHEVRDPFRREWLTTNFFEHPEAYRLGNVKNEEDLSCLRWTVDYEDDLEFITEIYERLYKNEKIFLMDDILELLKENPELMEINKGHVRDESYTEALKRKEK